MSWWDCLAFWAGMGSFWSKLLQKAAVPVFVEICFLIKLHYRILSSVKYILNFLFNTSSCQPPEFVMEVTDKTRADVKVRCDIRQFCYKNNLLNFNIISKLCSLSTLWICLFSHPSSPALSHSLSLLSLYLLSSLLLFIPLHLQKSGRK